MEKKHYEKIKSMNFDQLNDLAKNVREIILETTEKNGGHLASNLGIVELSVAINYVFDAQKDYINYDVGHQCYAHKILNGRDISTLRQFGGTSGFSSYDESKTDSVSSGHSGTALSQSIGQAVGLKLQNRDEKVVAVLGDGAFTDGETFEALNNITQVDYPICIILNDNEMSINKNVGAISKHFSKMRLSKGYLNFKRRGVAILKKIPLFGNIILWISRQFQKLFRSMFVRKNIFEHFGLKYIGIIDGHNIKSLVKILENAKKSKEKVLLHILTKKGKGLENAEKNPQEYHGVSKGIVCPKNEFSNFVGDCVQTLATKNEDICVVAAAMLFGTGFKNFSQQFANRTFDVGIAEQHAVTFSASLAQTGKKPYVAIYSSFLQRAYDQILIDVAINKMPVVFLVDRAGIVGADGKTHNGIFDVSYLCSVPNMTVVSPKDKAETKLFLQASQIFDSPLAIRYSNSYVGEFDSENASSQDFDSEIDTTELFKWEILNVGDNDKVIISYSNRLLHLCQNACDSMKEKGKNVTLINARTLKPLDEMLLQKYKNAKILVLEEQVESGSLGSQIAEFLQKNQAKAQFSHLCVGDKFVPQGSIDEIYELLNFTVENIESYFLD